MRNIQKELIPNKKNLGIRIFKFFFTPLVLTVLFFSGSPGYGEFDEETIHIERLATGELKVSDVLTDTNGMGSGIPQISQTNASGTPTEKTVSSAGPPAVPPNSAPVPSGVAWNCSQASGAGDADATFTDPDGDSFVVTWTITPADTGRVWNIVCTSGDCHTMQFSHDRIAGEGIQVWPVACDIHGNCTLHVVTWCTVAP